MSKLAELMDARASALAREKSRLDEARRFQREFTGALSNYLGVAPDEILFLKGEGVQVNTTTGKIVPDEDPFKFDHGQVRTIAMLSIEGTLVEIPLGLSPDPIGRSLTVVVGMNPAQQFDWNRGPGPLVDYVFTRIKSYFDSCDKVEGVVIL